MQPKKILFPVDLSDRSHAAAPYILSMARRYGASIQLLHVYPILPPIYFDMGAAYPDVFDEAPVRKNLQEQLRAFAHNEFPHTECTCSVESGDPAPVILQFAKENQSDLIAMPTHGYGPFRRALLGSVTAKVLHDSPVPVWTSAHACEADHRAHPQPRVVLAAIDLKAGTDNVLKTAIEIAREAGSAVEVLHVAGEVTASPVSSGRWLEQVERRVARAAAGGSARVEPGHHSNVHVAADGESIPAMVRRLALLRRADLVVIGAGAARRHLLERLGAHAYSVICESPCPVLTV